MSAFQPGGSPTVRVEGATEAIASRAIHRPRESRRYRCRGDAGATDDVRVTIESVDEEKRSTPACSLPLREKRRTTAAYPVTIVKRAILTAWVPLGLAPNAPVIRRYARAATALESELAEHSTPL